MYLQTFAEAIWKQGFMDITSLRRQRDMLEIVAETADRVPDEVDYDGTICDLRFNGRHLPERQMTIRFSRLGGTARVLYDNGISGLRSMPATPVNIRTAFALLDEEKTDE